MIVPALPKWNGPQRNCMARNWEGFLALGTQGPAAPPNKDPGAVADDLETWLRTIRPDKLVRCRRHL